MVALTGLLMTVGILLVALAAAFSIGLLFDAWAQVEQPRAFYAGELEALTTARLASFLVIFQVCTTVLSIASVTIVGPMREPLIAYAWPIGGFRTVAYAFGVLLLLAASYAAIIYNFDRPAFVHDLGPFAQLMQARTWWLLLIAAGIGAPIAEETLFRGFLYGMLKGTAAGRPVAALVTSGMWASLHANYSGYGLLAITLIGLYLTYLREKTRSLATPILCHAAYNATIILSLAYLTRAT